MKLRLKDNTIRIRLSVEEVHTLMKEDKISSATNFPGRESLTTCLGLHEQTDISVCFKDGEIDILLPLLKMKDWHLDDRVGHQWVVDLDQDDHLTILVEKDFKCLTERPGEDESALYPNPNESHG